MPTPLHILAEGDRWVAVAKPPALLTHRTPRFALDAALQRLRDQLGQRVYPVHRLDRGASGLLLFTTDAEVVHPLHEALRAGRKRYLALCRGQWGGPLAGGAEGVVRVESLLLDDNRLPKEACTDVEALGSCAEPRSCLLAAEPRTGRFHQVRRHVRDLGHPILGDNDHGDSRVNRWWREERGLRRLALHCATVELALPGGPLTLRCPLFADLHRVLQALPLWEEAVAREPVLGLPPLPDEDPS